MRFFNRYDAQTGSDSPSGKLFEHPRDGVLFDLTSVHVIGSYVDTVKQLYRGTINPEFLEMITEAIADRKRRVFFMGYHWLITGLPKSTGYQYSLTNAKLGMTILYKYFFGLPEQEHTHLKIELSPWFIDSRAYLDAQELMDDIAVKALISPSHNAVAVHLATDIQGWKPPEDFLKRIRTKARRVYRADGLDSVDTYDLNSISVTYGEGQTYTLGKPGGLQFCFYNKTTEAVSNDKLDYMQSKWSESSPDFLDPKDSYRPDLDVWRLEFRFHHSVIRDLSNGSESLSGLCSYEELNDHLGALFNYALSRYRYMYNKRFEHPVWTLLRSGSTFRLPDDFFEKDYRRYYKPVSSAPGRNFDLFIGNYMSMSVRQRREFKAFYNDLKGLGMWRDIVDHYLGRGKSEKELRSELRERYLERQLKGAEI